MSIVNNKSVTDWTQVERILERNRHKSWPMIRIGLQVAFCKPEAFSLGLVRIETHSSGVSFPALTAQGIEILHKLGFDLFWSTFTTK
jgi:hypothetical protein